MGIGTDLVVDFRVILWFLGEISSFLADLSVKVRLLWAL